MKELKKQTKSFIGSSKKNFTKEQLEDIDNGILPEGFTWHHNEKEGLVQLVEMFL